jgi:uncharacterized protein YceK
MKTSIAFFLVGFFVLTISGCSSISARAHDKFYPGVYPGVRNSAYYISHPQENDMPVVAVPFGILDFPLSAALDTVLLPFDWPYWATRKDSR